VRGNSAKGELMEETTMGERGADRLPDFIFERQKAVEEAYGFTLAGKLLTDIPSHEGPSERDRELIFELIQRLKDEFQRNPDMDHVSIWRNGKPPAALKSPFPDAAIRARAKRCLVVGVRVNPDGLLRLDDSQLAEIMGRH
jgi:hypothetical protein